MSSPGSGKTTVLGTTLDELTSGSSSMTTRQPTCTIGTVAICTSLQTKLNHSKRNAPARIGIRYGDPMVGVHRYPCADRLFGGGDGPGVASRCPALSEGPAHVADSWQLYGIPHCDSRDRQHLPRRQWLRFRGVASGMGPGHRSGGRTGGVHATDYGIRGYATKNAKPRNL